MKVKKIFVLSTGHLAPIATIAPQVYVFYRLAVEDNHIWFPDFFLPAWLDYSEGLFPLAGPRLYWPLDCSLLNWLWVKDTWTECLTHSLWSLFSLHKTKNIFVPIILSLIPRLSSPRSRGRCTPSWPSSMTTSSGWRRRRPSSSTRSSTATPGPTSPTPPPDRSATATRTSRTTGTTETDFFFCMSHRQTI